MCISIINNWPLPPFLFFLEVAIAILCYYQLQQKMVFQPDSSKRRKSQSKRRKNSRFRNKIIVLKLSNYLQVLDGYKTYKLCIILGGNYKFCQQYKSLDLVKVKIRQILLDRPSRVIKAMPIIAATTDC